MSTGTLFFLLLVLACPLSMLLMHRGGGHAHGSAGAAGDEEHAGHGCGHGGHGDRGAHRPGPHEDSIDELRRRREELDAEIEERERVAEP